jgi:hypothetical protein
MISQTKMDPKEQCNNEKLSDKETIQTGDSCGKQPCMYL